MAIITCPECSNTLSTKASNCPHCGAPVPAPSHIPPAPPLPVSGAQTDSPTVHRFSVPVDILCRFGIGVALLAPIFFAVCLLSAFTNNVAPSIIIFIVTVAAWKPLYRASVAKAGLRPPPVKVPIWIVLLIIVGVAAAFSVALIGPSFLFSESVSDTRPPISAPVVIRSSPAAGRPDAVWVTQQCGDISLDTPFPLRRSSEMMSEASAQTLNALSQHEVYEGHNTPESCHITVARMIYRPTIRLSLDGCVSGAIKALAGDTLRDVTSVHMTLDGLDARRSTFRGNTESTTDAFTFDGIFAMQSQTLWEIQIIYSARFPKAHIDRILSSVHIKPTN